MINFTEEIQNLYRKLRTYELLTGESTLILADALGINKELEKIDEELALVFLCNKLHVSTEKEEIMHTINEYIDAPLS